MVFTGRLILGVIVLLAACTYITASTTPQRRSYRRSVPEELGTSRNKTTLSTDVKNNANSKSERKPISKTDEPKTITGTTRGSVVGEVESEKEPKIESDSQESNSNTTDSNRKIRNRGNVKYFTTTSYESTNTPGNTRENVKGKQIDTKIKDSPTGEKESKAKAVEREKDKQIDSKIKTVENVKEKQIDNDVKAAAQPSVGVEQISKPDAKNREKSLKATEGTDKKLAARTVEGAKEKTDSRENAHTTKRIDSGRSLSMNIDKYISPEFHNQNNYYTLSITPDTKKFMNLRKDFKMSSYGPPDSISPVNFNSELTTPKNEFFDAKFHDVKEKVMQSLENIDHAFKHNSNQERPASKNIEDIKEELSDLSEHNNSKSDLEYKKFRNIEASESRNRNKIHRDYVSERGTNLGLVSSYNDTKILGDINDGVNKIPATAGGTRYGAYGPENLPDLDNQESKKETLKIEVADKPYQVFSKAQVLIPPRKNETEAEISPVNNKIETDDAKKTRSSASPSIDPITSESDYEKASRENVISVFKRGSTEALEVSSSTVEETSEKVEKTSLIPDITSTNTEKTQTPESSSPATTVNPDVDGVTVLKEYEGNSRENAVIKESSPKKLSTILQNGKTTQYLLLSTTSPNSASPEKEKTSKENVINSKVTSPSSDMQEYKSNSSSLNNDIQTTLSSYVETTNLEGNHETTLEQNIIHTPKDDLVKATEVKTATTTQHSRIPGLTKTTTNASIMEANAYSTSKENTISVNKRGSTKMAEILSTLSEDESDKTTQHLEMKANKNNVTTSSEDQPNEILSKSSERQFTKPIGLLEELKHDTTESPTTTDDAVASTTDDVLNETTTFSTPLSDAFSSTMESTSPEGTSEPSLGSTTVHMTYEISTTTHLPETFNVSTEETSTVNTEDDTQKSTFLYSVEELTTTDNTVYYPASGDDNFSASTDFTLYEVTTAELVPLNTPESVITSTPAITDHTSKVTDTSLSHNVTSNMTSAEILIHTNEESAANLTENDILKQNEIHRESKKSGTPQKPKNPALDNKDSGMHDLDDTTDDVSLINNDASDLDPDTLDIDPDDPVMVDKPTNKNSLPLNLSTTTHANTVQISPTMNYVTHNGRNEVPTAPVDVEDAETTTIGDNLGLTGPSEDDNGGTIAAIVISSVGAVCLLLLAGLLIVMRKRQKRFNYPQRCRPVSLDAYSMDNVSVYSNTVRRKGVLRTSKRSYGNPAFDDPVSATHPLNFSGLTKFANNLDDIRMEFEEIPQVTTRTNELPEGCEVKNRYANVIPLPETRVFLNLIDGYSNSDYINANYVRGPKGARHYYIGCQAPMQNTIEDFWRMIWEQQSKVILMLTNLFENGVEKCADYLPPSEVLDCHRVFGDFQITLKNREIKDKYIISSLQLKNMVSNSWREIIHLWYLGWPEKGVPDEANSIIAFLIEARSYVKTATLPDNKSKDASNGNVGNDSITPELSPVVVHCSPGTGRTGTVIACDIAIREFELSRQVDIPKIVYRIRRDRASSVQTKDQYAFIYKVINLYATKLTGGALDSI